MQVVGQVVGLFRGDDEGAGVPEGVQDDALVLHPAPGEPVQVHDQHRVVAALLHVLQQAQHLRPGVQALAADHLLIGGDDVDVMVGGVLLQRLPVPGEHFLRIHALLHAGFSQIFRRVHWVPSFAIC